MKRIKRWGLLFILLFLMACQPMSTELSEGGQVEGKDHKEEDLLDEDAYYYSLDDVVAYLRSYDKLPDNYITKGEAKKLGWDPRAGNLWEVAPEMVIGGDSFGNREKKLPPAKYKEADIHYNGGYRGPERIVFSEDEIYYTKDHYETFEKVE
ncbi:MAG: ribonuclease domain-containing protein [Tissierellia bacterium]|nr:ribonuclease domain-containing protein [Tissierellia bacterium]